MTTTGKTDATEERLLFALLEDDPKELYEHAPCGYLSTSPDGSIVRANATFCSWVGLPPQRLIGTHFQELLGRGDQIYYETHVDPLLRMQGQVREIALELVVGDRRLPVIASAVAKRDDTGEHLLTRVVLIDARERRAYEQELLDARQAAEASEARAQTLARTLQQSLLPPQIPLPPGLDIGAAYRPAGDGSIVGGDFFDVFEQADGSVVLLLGDVSGKGPRAATLAALARDTVRTEAMRRRDPAAMLRTVGEAFLRYHPDDFCTATITLVSPPPRTQAVIATGGHYLPLRRSPDGSVSSVGSKGRILGILPDPEIGSCTVGIGPSEIFAIFTDGIVEARRDEDVVASGTLDVFEQATSRTAQEIAEALAGAAVQMQDGNPRDDIAVLVWRRSDR